MSFKQITASELNHITGLKFK
ncbi:MAG TPA: hypothetical protein DCY06_00140 [Bacteroidetes bacterium]|nr:hypothetical protein [Bacteroidota bacterium]